MESEVADVYMMAGGAARSPEMCRPLLLPA